MIRPKQNVVLPENANRSIYTPNLTAKSDPSFSTYWFIERANIACYTEQFGSPDLMLTLTFSNRWKDVKECLKSLSEIMNCSSLAMPYCPYESMAIWHSHMKKIRSNNYNDFLQSIGIGKCIHYVERLEFQGRGAPHVHLLIWLDRILDINEIKKHFTAEKPPPFCNYLHSIINKEMIHSCVPERCFKGKNSQCKYGFPKKNITETHIDEENHIIFKRNHPQIIEYCPVLLLKWRAHAHVHVLKCSEMDLEAQNQTIHYVLKYNAKEEPNQLIKLQINQSADDDQMLKAIFHSRVVGAEEAIARIFSFHFIRKDTECLYLKLCVPEKRKAMFNIYGKQTTLDEVEAYYCRPPILHHLTILQFYSLYTVRVATEQEKSNLTLLDNMVHQGASDTNYETIINDENQNDLLNSIPEDRVLLMKKSLSFPSVDINVCVRRNKPILITFPSFNLDTQQEEFCYFYLLISRPWNREEELLFYGDFDTYSDAIKGFKLISDGLSVLQPFSSAYISFLITHERYSIEYVANNIFHLIQEGLSPQLIFDLLETLDNHRSISVCTRLKQILDTYNTNDTESNGEIMKKYICAHYSAEERKEARDLFEERYKNLNIDQKRAVDSVINGFPSRSPHLIYGSAGTGKSYVIETLKLYFKSINAKFCVTSSTGISAILIGGRTVHSAFALFEKDRKIYSGLSINNIQGKSIAELEVLFVDEISMLNKEVFDTVSEKLKEFKKLSNQKNANRLFGGVQIILTGDLAQVPCVCEGDDLENFRMMFPHMHDFEEIIKIQLSIIQRQENSTSNNEFMKVLDFVRRKRDDSSLPKEIIDIFKSRYTDMNMYEVNTFLSENGSDGLAIFYRNRSCNAYNQSILENFIESNAIEKENIKCIDGIVLRSGSLSYNFGQPQKTNLFDEFNVKDQQIYKKLILSGKAKCIIPFTLKLCIGCKIMLLKNIDQTKGLVNGRRGVVTGFHCDDNGTVHSVEITFPSIAQFEEISYNITRKHVDTFKLCSGRVLKFYQFPLRLAYAVTAHKAQGQTLNKCAIAIDEDAFAHGAFYVALSRVKRFEDLIRGGITKLDGTKTR